MRWAGALWRELSTRNQQIAVMNGSVHELTAGEMPSVIFGRNESRSMEISIPPPTETFAQTRNGRTGSSRFIRDRTPHGR